jgi:cytochrome c biogenesis protein
LFIPKVRRGLIAAASLRLTLASLLLLGAGVVYAYFSAGSATVALVGPLALLALNLFAAILSNPVFRRQTPLLVFHLALLALVLLVAAGRLTYLKGQLELAAGETFAGALTATEAGPWHVARLDRAAFTNLGFRIDYAPGRQRAATQNRVAWTDEAGQRREALVGDHHPLVRAGYRFYTTHNKGFSLVFTWRPRGGAPVRGTVNLPSYPVHEYGQAREWQPPGAAHELWTLLAFDEVLIDPGRPGSFRLPREHRVVLRVGEEGAARHELVPGAHLALADGELVYEGLTTWMGYRVFHDWTLPWLLAAALVGILSLAWHFWSRYAARPWQAEQGHAVAEGGRSGSAAMQPPIRGRAAPTGSCGRLPCTPN